MRLALALLLVVLAAPQSHSAFELFEFESAAQEERYKDLTSRLRCLVCQNQSLSDSDAGLAADLRNAIHERLVAGETDEQIVGFLLERYGEFVLYEPPLRASTLLLWLGPFAVLALGLLALRNLASGGRRRGN